MNVKPLADRVLVLPAPVEEKTVGGIIIPDTSLLYHVSTVASRNIRFASCGTSGKLTLWTRLVHNFAFCIPNIYLTL
jgi:hypothetical protein